MYNYKWGYIKGVSLGNNPVWTEKELKGLIQELKKNDNIFDAIERHNNEWGNSRTLRSIEHKFERLNYGSPKKYLKSRKAAAIKTGEPDDHIKKLIDCIAKGARDISTICNVLDLSPKRAEGVIEEALSRGYKIAAIEDSIVLQKTLAPKILRIQNVPIKMIDKEFSFAAISDLHAGSIHMAKQELKDFVEYAYGKRGIRHITISGDVLAGMNMYRGQENELEVHGLPDVMATKQIEILVNTLSKKPDLKYYFITGNHDLSFLSSYGFDVGERIEKIRPDMVYLGAYTARMLLNGVKVELLHPDGGGSYALSYALQKNIESTPAGQKPQILLSGHFHRHFYVYYRSVQALEVATFESASLWLRRKKLYPTVGGWIIKVGLDKDNSIRSFQPEFISYFANDNSIIES